MSAHTGSSRATVALIALALVATATAALPGARAQEGVDPGPVPRAVCGPGSDPETGRQGRITFEDVESGRMEDGVSCNTDLVGHHGTQAGLKVARFIDEAGHECAYYDTEVTFPLGGPLAGHLLPTTQSYGTYVLDMADPSNPTFVESLRTPAMVSPHESLLLNQERGLLVAVMGNALYYPGFVDVYDVNEDCRHPTLLSSLPGGILGHESGFSPDGMTFWASSLAGGTLTAVDLTDPTAPLPVWVGNYFNHGLSISDDGNRAYLASTEGLKILDVSEVQAREDNPEVTLISELTWPTLSIPQITWPVTIDGHPYVIEMDEFGTGEAVGAARIIDIGDETKPKVISNIRLEVNMPEHQAEQESDPGGNNNGLGDYTGHYCDIPKRVDPEIVACTFILSGLRIFDIRDPYHPREIAYYNAPQPKDEEIKTGAYAMSNAVFVPERSEIWYSDSQTGFWAIRVTNDVWGANGVGGVAAAAPEPVQAPRGEIPATGGSTPVVVVGGALALAIALRAAQRRLR